MCIRDRISFDRCIFFLHHVIRQGKRHNAAPHAYKSLRLMKVFLKPVSYTHLTHEPIIDQQTFDLVQKIRGNVKRYPDGWGEAAPLTGLLYCADCGGKMYVHLSLIHI